MSLRYSSNINGLLVVPALVFGMGVGAPAFAANAVATPRSAVQSYANQAAPSDFSASPGRYDSPLAAGTLTLQDVLEAHRDRPPTGSKLPPIRGASPTATATAPLLTSPVQSSSTGLMMSQGMKDVLQKIGGNARPAPPTLPTAPILPAAPVASVPIVPPAQAQTIPLSLAPAAAATGVKYQPGQEPKNLGALAGSPTPVAAPAPEEGGTPVPAERTLAEKPAAENACDPNPQRWEKSCAEAGYPGTFVGKIVGETRTGCADGALHDVWVTNSCAPPDAQVAKSDGGCGSASNNEFDTAPAANLCAQGIPSAVSGDGPWTWACSGVNGGSAAACTAPRHVIAVNGFCGSANGKAVSAAPAVDLCDAGESSSVKGYGPWTWTCKGIGSGHSQSCIASVLASEAPIPAASVEEEEKPAPVAAAPRSAPAPRAAPVAVASAEKEDLCGEAAETLAYEAPEKDLCRTGTASPVNGEGPWSWSCTSNEGVTSSCRSLSLNGDAPPEPSAKAPASARANAMETATPSASILSLKPQAPAAPVATSQLACGLAAEHPTLQPPTTELCHGGKASAVRGSGPWRWTCSGKARRKISCETPKVVDGSCGAANGAALKSVPFAGLCSSGTPSSVEGEGPWTWSCNGSGGGVDVSCAASPQAKPEKINGACGTSDGQHLKEAPTEGLCANGMPSAVGGEGPWTWSCSGANGGSVGSCSAAKIQASRPPGPLVNGLCGSANGVTSTLEPIEELCASGTLSGVVGNGPWNWSCIGQNGGMTVSCTAPLEPPAPIDGECGRANGTPTSIKPQSGLCNAGITGSVNGKGPWTWTCSGANGGTPASCIAPAIGKSGSMPSLMTTASGAPQPILSAPPAASTPDGLVTPHLPSDGAIPSLDRQTLPSLTSSKSFSNAPTPSNVPSPARVTGNQAPSAVPELPEGLEPLQPPSFSQSLPSAAVLKEDAASRAAQIPGNRLTLDPTVSTVLFKRNSGNIDEGVLSTLNRLASILNDNPDVRVSLIAFADGADSTPRGARRLSLTRALAVRDYLSSKGVSESRIDVHAEGLNTTSGYIDRVDVKINN